MTGQASCEPSQLGLVRCPDLRKLPHHSQPQETIWIWSRVSWAWKDARMPLVSGFEKTTPALSKKTILVHASTVVCTISLRKMGSYPAHGQMLLWPGATYNYTHVSVRRPIYHTGFDNKLWFHSFFSYASSSTLYPCQSVAGWAEFRTSVASRLAPQ